jgi:hypothetical protein
VDASNDRLREIPQWPWRWRTVRWVHQAGRSVSWKLQRPDRPRFDIYSGLQELLAANMGSTGELNTNGLNRWTHMTRCDAKTSGVHWGKVITFEKAGGWIQWTWKTESADDWSYSAGLQYGWIPLNPTDRKYPNICG